MLHVFEFLPSGLALLDGETHSASNRNPVGTESRVPFEFNQAAITMRPSLLAGSVVVVVVACACVL